MTLHSITPPSPPADTVSGVALVVASYHSRPVQPACARAPGVIKLTIQDDATDQFVLTVPRAFSPLLKHIRIQGESELPVVTIWGPEVLSTHFAVSSESALILHPSWLDGEWPPAGPTPDPRYLSTMAELADLSVACPDIFAHYTTVRLPRGRSTLVFDVKPGESSFLPLAQWMDGLVARKVLTSTTGVQATVEEWSAGVTLNCASTRVRGWVSRPTSL